MGIMGSVIVLVEIWQMLKDGQVRLRTPIEVMFLQALVVQDFKGFLRFAASSKLLDIPRSPVQPMLHRE